MVTGGDIVGGLAAKPDDIGNAAERVQGGTSEISSEPFEGCREIDYGNDALATALDDFCAGGKSALKVLTVNAYQAAIALRTIADEYEGGDDDYSKEMRKI